MDLPLVGSSDTILMGLAAREWPPHGLVPLFPDVCYVGLLHECVSLRIAGKESLVALKVGIAP